MRLARYLLGIDSPDSDKCQWCKKAIDQEEHAPVPVCAPCYSKAARHPVLWDELMTLFRSEAEDMCRRMQARPVSSSDALQDQLQATQDVLALQAKAARLARAGKDEEAAAVRKEAEAKAKSVAQFTREMGAMGPRE